MLKNIKPKDAMSIINSLNSGVTPNIGIQHIVVGRDREIEALLNNIKEVMEGNSVVKFWIGEFGSGKSFMLSLLKIIALKQNFVVANADFNPERRLYGRERKAVSTYSELVRNISIQTQPDGNALPIILEKWIERLFITISEEKKIPLGNLKSMSNFQIIQEYIYKKVLSLTEVGGFDFAMVIAKYVLGYISGDDFLQNYSLKWLRGEYTTKTEARQNLGVREIINDNNYYDMLKNLCKFFLQIGYKGFMINFDEAVNLYKISNSISRNKNYDKLLSIFNDCMQGNVSNLFINITGVPVFLNNEKRGLYSNNAIKTRLAINRFENEEVKDFEQPVITLTPLQPEEIFVLLKKIKSIYEYRYSIKVDFNDSEIKGFMEYIYNQRISSELLTPREFIKEFLNILKILRQNPNYDKNKLLASINIKPIETEIINIENLSDFEEI